MLLLRNMLAIEKDWQKFKDARPGRRFKTLHARIEDYPLWQRVLRAAAGGVLSGVISPLAHAMDRAEPAVRDWLEHRKEQVEAAA